MFINNTKRFNPFTKPIEYRESEINRRTRLYFSQRIKNLDLVKKKFPGADLRLKYKKNLEVSLATTICLFILCFQLARHASFETKSVAKKDIQIEVADIPQTRQLHKPPPPTRPSLPVPTEDETVPENLTIASTEIDLSNIPAPPPPPQDDSEDMIFVAYDEPPSIVGGISALMKHLEYPKLAQNAGLEGEVLLKVLVGSDGSTEKVELLRSTTTGAGFENSAIKAIYQVRWKPAKQRDRSIRVWISCPVVYRL